MAIQDVCKVEGDRRIRTQTDTPSDLKGNFSEAEPTLSLKEAVAEAKRCAQASPCLYCEVCQLLCPDLAMVRDQETGHIQIDLDYCKGCGLCAMYCPHSAIKMVLEVEG